MIASAEIIAVNAEIADRVAKALQERHGLSRHQLLLTATHTHYAPEFRPDKQLVLPHSLTEYGAKIPAVADKLIDVIYRSDRSGTSAARAGARCSHEDNRRFCPQPTAARRKGRQSFQGRHVGPGCTRAGLRGCFRQTQSDCFRLRLPLHHDTAGRFALLRRLGRLRKGATPADKQRSDSALHSWSRRRSRSGAARSLELSRQYGHELAQSVQTALDGPGSRDHGPIRIGWEDVRLSLQPITREAMSKMLNSDDPPQQVKAKFLIDQLDVARN